VSDVAMYFRTKGAGLYRFFSDGGTTVQQFAIGHVPSAVNYPVAQGQITGRSPSLYAAGADTDIGLRLAGKGTAYVHTDEPLIINSSVNSNATAGDRTLTAAQLLGGTIVRDCAGAGRTDTLPTAALLVAAIPGVATGDTVQTLIINGSDAAETITLAAGSGGAFDANQTAASRVIPQNTSKLVRCRITNIGSGTEAYVVYA
jgi:hypothetical protein